MQRRVGGGGAAVLLSNGSKNSFWCLPGGTGAESLLSGISEGCTWFLTQWRFRGGAVVLWVVVSAVCAWISCVVAVVTSLPSDPLSQIGESSLL
jgi:hypothetical protein